MRLKVTTAAALAAANPNPLAAQSQASANPTPPRGSPGPSIVVTGERANVQSSLDRTSYRISNDLQGSTGSIADVLRNLPSVDVDIAGNVSLRGDPDVVILVDGQPRGVLRGDSKGAALLQMPAGDYERVEVMTTPSAAFGPEGSGGIINLISKKDRRRGWSGSTRANAGTLASMNGGLSLTHSTATRTLSGDFNFRRDEVRTTSVRDRSWFDAAGQPGSARQSSRADTETLSKGFKLGATQKVGLNTSLNLEANGSSSQAVAEGLEDYRQSALTPANFRRRSTTGTMLDRGEARVQLTRTLPGEKHALTLSLSIQGSKSTRTLSSLTDFSAQMAADLAERFGFSVTQRYAFLKTEYGRPIGKGTRLQLGYEFERQRNDFRNVGERGLATAGLEPLPSFTNRFAHRQTVHSAYATIETRVEKAEILAGLRWERVALGLNQETTSERTHRHYARAYPSLTVSQDVGEQELLKVSYSRRVQRPQGQDLNPFREYRDPFNVREGNPRLRPQITDSLEFAWQRRLAKKLTRVALFHRAARNGFVDIAEDLGSGVLLTRRENLGRNRSTGLDVIVNRPLSKTITINYSATLARTVIDTRDLGLADRRSIATGSGRATINWQLTPVDEIQLNGFYVSRTLRPQGHGGAHGMISVGYRRRINPAMSLVATVRDLLGNFGEVIDYRTPTLSDRARRKFGGRIIFVGFNYNFGRTGADRKEQGFDFDAGRTE